MKQRISKSSQSIKSSRSGTVSIMSLKWEKSYIFRNQVKPMNIEPVQLSVNRSAETASFPAIEGNIQFIIIEKGEDSAVCGSNPEAYVVDTMNDWDNSIAKKIRSDCEGNPSSDSPQPVIDFNNNTALAYFWGQKPNSANFFSIMKIEADPINSSVRVILKFKDGPAEALSYPYIIATIPKTSYKKFVFEHSL